MALPGWIVGDARRQKDIFLGVRSLILFFTPIIIPNQVGDDRVILQLLLQHPQVFSIDRHIALLSITRTYVLRKPLLPFQFLCTKLLIILCL